MLIVERIINNIVILENDDLSQIKVDINKFNYDVKESDVVILQNNYYILDKESTQKRKQYMIELSNNIFNK